MNKTLKKRPDRSSGEGLKILSILLLVIGGIMLFASLAFPEGEKEEKSFMVSAQGRQNQLDHGNTKPKNNSQAAQESHAHQDYDDALFMRAEHMLVAGIVFDVIGTVLFVVYMLRKQNSKQQTELSKRGDI